MTDIEIERPTKAKREVTLEQRQRLSAQLAKGRATAAANRAAGKTAHKKTAADVRNASGPKPAERADLAREDMSRIPMDQITRRSREERDTGALVVPSYLKKRGWDYQYITIRVWNEPVDGSELRAFREGGWRPVLASEMPELADDGQNPNSPLESKGCRLYTRPLTLTREAQQEDLNVAMRQQQDKMRAAVDGEAKGADGLRQRGATRPVGGSVTIEGVAG